jgi:cyclophilin family peptidyl-prolyl cis-trans isomerase
MRLALSAVVILVCGTGALAQDAPPADIPLTEKVAKNHEARQKGEPLPYPEAEQDMERQRNEAERIKNDAAARARRAQEGGNTPAISPGGAAGTPAAVQDTGKTRVAMTVGVGDEDWGTIVIELYDDRAPQSVANFLRYVDSGFYNGTIFHRIKPRYIVQGGGFVADFQEKTDGLQSPVPNEAARGEKNKRGTIAVARSRHDPNSGTSQFFFNLADNPRLDFSGENPGYCAFGRVVDGMEVLEKLATTRVRRSTLVTNEVSQPMTPPQIKVARRLAPGESVPSSAAPGPDGQPAPAAQPPKPAAPPGGDPADDEDKRDTGDAPPDGGQPGDKPN